MTEARSAAATTDPDNKRAEPHIPIWVVATVLLVVGSVVPLIIAHHFGALGIARNDDWAYLLSAFQFGDNGTINGFGWPGMNLVGQLALALPTTWLFAHDITALQIETTALGFIGLVAVYDLASRVLRSRGRSLFVAVMVAVGPMWASLSVSFMTDIPAFALAMGCLAIGARSLAGAEIRRRWFCTAVLVGFIGFTIRESVAVAPAALLLVALWPSGRRPRASRATAWFALLGFVVFGVAFMAWQRGLPGFQRIVPATPAPSTVKDTLADGARMAVLLGLLVAPAVSIANPRRLVLASWRRAPRASIVVGTLSGAATALLIVSYWDSARFLGPGNYVIPNGSLGTATVARGVRPDLFPSGVWVLIAVIASLSLVIALLAAVRPVADLVVFLRQRSLPPLSPTTALVSVAAIGFAVTCLAPPLFEINTFDRYLLPVVPLVGILLIRLGQAVDDGRDSPIWKGLVGLALLATIGLIFAANSASFDGAKWRVADATARTVGVRQVEGGFEWGNYHAQQELFFDANAAARRRYCAVIKVASRPSGSRQTRSVAVWGPTGTQAWLLAEQRKHC